MTSFCVIGIYVHDIDKALEFYRDILGFKVESTYDDGCIVQLAHEGPTVILEKVDKPNPAKYPVTSQIVLGIETDNIDNSYAELKTKSVDFVQESPQPFVAGRFAAMRDPSGNLVELLEFRKE